MSILIYCLLAWILLGILSVAILQLSFKCSGISLHLKDKEDVGCIITMIILGLGAFVLSICELFSNVDFKYKIKKTYKYVFRKFKK